MRLALDGKIDLAVANRGSSTVSVLLGNGDGTLGTAANYSGGANQNSLAVGDFNGDSKADLAVAQGVTNDAAVSILLNTTIVPLPCQGNIRSSVFVNTSCRPGAAGVSSVPSIRDIPIFLRNPNDAGEKSSLHSMYGPPPNCKRFEVGRKDSPRKCIRPLRGEITLRARDDDSHVSVLLNP